MKSPHLPQAFSIALVVMMMGCFLYVGNKGINFGYHWDEWLTIDAAAKSMKTKVFSPPLYDHPGMAYDLAVFAAGLFPLVHPHTDLESLGFRLWARRFFLAASSLTILWVFLIGLWTPGGSAIKGLIAAAILTGSWEFGYHSRWGMSDTLMAQFTALTMLGLTLAWERPPRMIRWLLASVSAGMACGAKTPAGILVFLVVGLCFAQAFGRSQETRLFWKIWTSLQNPLLCSAIFAATFLITTPWALLNFHKFAFDTTVVSRAYANGVHGMENYFAVGLLSHLEKILQYLSLSALSPFPPLALCLFLLGMMGCLDWAYLAVSRRNFQTWGHVVLWIGYPTIYLMYFSFQKLMVVRNFMVILPFLALLSAHGLLLFVKFLTTSLTLRHTIFVPVIAGLLIGSGFVVNELWLNHAADTIVQYRPGQLSPIPKDLLYRRIWLAPSLRSLYRDHPGIVQRREDADLILFQLADLIDGTGIAMKANVFNNYHLFPAGPWDVNFNYYPTWSGPMRPIWVTRQFAQSAGLLNGLRS